jgi:broad specificity phosphatase PhoE
MSEKLKHARRRIYLMRHGNVTYFDVDGAPFHPDTVPLNEQGRAQATAAGKVFAEQAVRFDRVIVSGLPRTVQTAQHVLTETGQQIELEVWPELEELKGGKLSQIRDDELKNAFISAFEGLVTEDKQFLGGETIGQLMDRIHPCLGRLRADPEWDTVLLVLHGGVNRAILSFALTGQRLFMGGLAQIAGCINVLDVGVHPLDWVVRIVNYSPLSQLQDQSRDTTMESLWNQYKKARGL